MRLQVVLFYRSVIYFLLMHIEIMEISQSVTKGICDKHFHMRDD